MTLAGVLTGLLDLEMLSRDATEALKTLDKFGGVLLVHLMFEDSSLYPRLQQHDDPKVRAKAIEFLSTMGGLRMVFEGYYKRWSRVDFIQGNPAMFADETKMVLDALGKRIERENTELYALIDALEIHVG